MFQAPAVVLSLALASAYALAFLLWQGRPLRRLPSFWLASVVGFALGQIVGEEVLAIPWRIGQVRIVEATVGSVLLLLVVSWLKRERKAP